MTVTFVTLGRFYPAGLSIIPESEKRFVPVMTKQELLRVSESCGSVVQGQSAEMSNWMASLLELALQGRVTFIRGIRNSQTALCGRSGMLYTVLALFPKKWLL